MSRLSFRPRPLDIHKKLPILKSYKDFEDDDTPTRNPQLLRLASSVELDHEVALPRADGGDACAVPEAVQDLGETMEIGDGVDQNAKFHGSLFIRNFGRRTSGEV